MTIVTRAGKGSALTHAELDANFTDLAARHLGNKTGDPALDNEGNALQVGAQYYNTAWQVLRVFKGSGVWENVGLGGTFTPIMSAGVIKTLTGFKKVSGTNFATGGYSIEKVSQARLSLKAIPGDKNVIFGLHSSPTDVPPYDTLNFGIQLRETGACVIFTNGEAVGAPFAYAANDVFGISHEGIDVVAYKNGTEAYRWTASTTVDAAYSFSLIFAENDAEIANVSFNGMGLVRTNFSGLPVYANNATAIAGGLVVGSLYRTGADPDPLNVVH